MEEQPETQYFERTVTPAGSVCTPSPIAKDEALTKVKLGRWWRASYVITLIAMVAGGSSFDLLAQYSPALRAGSLTLLAVVTFISTRNQSGSQSTLGKAVIVALWATGAIGLASSVWSEFPQTTVIYAATFLVFVYVLQRISSVRWKSKNCAQGDLAAGYFTMVVVIFAGLVLAGLGNPSVTSWTGRHQGLFNNPNLLGMLATITFTLGLAVAVKKKSVGFWLLLVLPAVAIAASGSRTAAAALLISVVWVLIRRGALSAVVAAFAVTVFLVTLGVSDGRFFSSVFGRFESNDGRDLLNSRSLAWEEAFRVLQTNPLGVGFGSTAEAIENYSSSGLFVDGLSSIHNSYFQIMFEVGWVGCILAFLYLMIFIFIVLRVDVKGFNSGLVAAVVAGTLIQVTESAMFGLGQPYPYLFWFIVMASTLRRKSA